MRGGGIYGGGAEPGSVWLNWAVPQGVRGVELVQAAADRGEELRSEHGADARDAQDDVGEFVLAKPALDELVLHTGIQWEYLPQELGVARA